MAKELPHRKILLASPSDVTAERELLRKGIANWNKVHGGNYGTIFDVIGFEDATPGIGAEAQAVLDDQIVKDFDIFVCIIWNRIGSPTKNSKSGTVSEYEKALKKWQADPNSVKILIYFKTTAFRLDEIDPEQLAEVKNFKDRVHDDGVLFREFDEGTEFIGLIGSHFTKLALDFEGFSSKDEAAKNIESYQSQQNLISAEKDLNTEKPSHDAQASEDEAGILDYEEMISEATDKLSLILGDLSEELVKIGDGARDAVSEIAKLPPDAPMKEKKKIFGKVADRLDICSEAFEKNKEPLLEVYLNLGNSIQGLIDTAGDFDSFDAEELEALQINIQGLHSEMIGTSDEISTLSVTLGQIPRMARQLNVAKRRLSLLLDETASLTFSTASKLVDDIEVLGEMIEKRQN